MCVLLCEWGCMLVCSMQYIYIYMSVCRYCIDEYINIALLHNVEKIRI